MHIPRLLLLPPAILAISLLVIIHEFGHYLVARAFGMRVITYSIGFGPVLVRWRPKGSETVFQVCAIPLLAYVQIAGMNPREESDPHDRGSYQNASPIARFLTIAAGPVANYVAAGLALFMLLAIGGEQIDRAQVGRVHDNTPAAAAGMHADDTVRRINGAAVTSWGDVLRATRASQGRPMEIVVDRGDRLVNLTVTPRLDPEAHAYRIGIEMKPLYRPVSLRAAAETAIVGPAIVTAAIVKQLGGMIRRRERPNLIGPVGIVSATVEQAERGWRDAVEGISGISLSLFIFNLLPIPALDGGRLVVLGYEMVMRRRFNPKVEAKMLAASLMLMIGLFLIVTFKESWSLISRLFTKS
jgi:regulator of sigma E protease